MSVAKRGDRVRVHYRGTLSDGKEFDSSLGQEPLGFVLGAGRVIPGFEQAVLGMRIGESKTVVIEAAEAYGPHRPEMIQEIPRSAIPPEIALSEGLVLQARSPEGRTLSFSVVSFDEERVKVDGNHPLAGQDLTFELELVEIA